LAGIDAVDGTPVLDVKPYLPWNESRPEAQAEWAGDSPIVREASAVRATASVESVLRSHRTVGGRTAWEVVAGVLRLNLQPAYLDEPERVYGMQVADHNVRWRFCGSEVEILEAKRIAEESSSGNSVPL
jgi:hypothetical protein